MTATASTDTLQPFALDATAGEFHGEFSFPLGGVGRLPIRITRDDDGTFLATDLLTDSYGVGFSAGEAIANLLAAVRRHHEFLRTEGPNRLSARLWSQLQTLERDALHSADAARLERSSRSTWSKVYAA